MSLDLSKLNCHQNWLKQLGGWENVSASRRQKMEEHAFVEMKTSYSVRNYARALLVFLHTESGVFRKAESLLQYSPDDADTQDTIEGFSYLLKAQQVFLLQKEGKVRQAKDLLNNLSRINLNQKDEAYLYAAKNYTLARVDQGKFRSAIMECSEMAIKLDPHNNSYKMIYAIALGRQRRILGFVRLTDIQERIENEQKLLKLCMEDPKPFNKQAHSFYLFLENELVEAMIKDKEQSRTKEFWETIETRNKKTYLGLEELYYQYKTGGIEYDKLFILKRMAMLYARLSGVKRFANRRDCYQRADELFNECIKITEGFHSSVGFEQLLVEYGKFCETHKKYEKAMSQYKQCWEKLHFGEALFRFIHCKQRIDGVNYDPIIDIAEGVHHLSQEKTAHIVILYCLRGDYYKSCKGDIENTVESWIDALKCDPWGKTMCKVPSQFGKWCCSGPDNFVDFYTALFELLEGELKKSRVSGDYKMEITYLSYLAKCNELKEPQDTSTAKLLLTNAIELAKKFGKPGEEKIIENQLESLTEVDDFESRFMKTYKNVEEIGRGGFGIVFKATHDLDGKQYAIKAVRYKNESVIKEVSTLSALDHKHVVRYYTSWIEHPPTKWANNYLFKSHNSSDVNTTEDSLLPEDEQTLPLHSEIDYLRISSEVVLFIQMELCQMSLRSWMDEHENKNQEYLQMVHIIFKQCVDALDYIHQKGYTHKDVKPTNIFVTTVDAPHITVKIGDFGLAKYIEEKERFLHPSSTGGFDYKAPELLARNPYGNKIDVYSLGLILFELLECNDNDRISKLLHIRKGSYPPEFDSKFKVEYKILCKMLETEPSSRCSASDVRHFCDELKSE